MKIRVENINVIHLSNGDTIRTALPIVTIEVMAEMAYVLVDFNRKVTAIKSIRKAFDCGLREAKCFVEDAARV